jgi:hypothetical protein
MRWSGLPNRIMKEIAPGPRPAGERNVPDAAIQERNERARPDEYSRDQSMEDYVEWPRKGGGRAVEW